MFHLKFSTTRGFTLVELLAAIFIFSLIGLGSWQLLSQAIRADQVLEEKSLRLLELNQGLQLIADDLYYFLPIEIRIDQFESNAALTGRPEKLDFIRLGHLPLPSTLGGEMQSLQYEFIREGGSVTLFRRQSYFIDGSDIKDSKERVLITGIRDFRLEYIDKELKFYSEWPRQNDEEETKDSIAQQEVPIAIRLYLDLFDYGEIYRLYEIPAGSDTLNDKA